MKPEKLSQETIRAVEDKIKTLTEALTELELATLYTYLHYAGMSLQKAYEIRVKSGAVN